MPLSSKVPRVGTQRPSFPRAQLRVEQLEAREVLYSVSSGAWVHPELITLSFVPDGTILTYNSQGQPITSTLFADFNARWSTSTWQNAILKGAQVWARQTNINFAIVPDDGSEVGLPGLYQQGASNYGDIRIGGARYTTLVGATFLAQAYMPPQLVNWSLGGDIQFNTEAGFNIGSTFDLFTVAAHEVGHALGLNHSSDPNAIMYSAYPGTKTDLLLDDIAGIRTIYSSGQARTVDALDANGSNGTSGTADTLAIDAITKTALVTDLDLTTPADNDYYKFTIPAGSGTTLKVKIQSAGLSLLAPKAYLYNSALVQKGFASGAGQYGTTLTITFNGIVAGEVYYVRVVGNDTGAFSTGKYALTLNTGTGVDPIVPLPNTQTLNGDPLITTGGTGIHPDGYYPDGHEHDHDEDHTGFDAGTVASGVNVGKREGTTFDVGLVDNSARKDQRHERRGPKITPAQRRFWGEFGSDSSEEGGEIAPLSDLDPLARLLAKWGRSS
jgi:hypothetical protein